MSSMDESIQAMQALSAAQRITAHNVANVNTDGFDPSRVHLEDGPGGEGVAVSAITKAGASSWVTRREPPLEQGAQAASASQGERPSGTEVSREMVNLIRNQRGLEANAVFFRNAHEMLGAVMDVKA